MTSSERIIGAIGVLCTVAARTVARIVAGVRYRLTGTGRGAAHRAREAGTATAEYAIVTMAAVTFGSMLVAIVRSAEVRALLLSLIRRALHVA